MLHIKYYGIGTTTIMKIYKKIGLNTRKNPKVINKDKTNSFEINIKKIIQGKQLKNLITDCVMFKKKIKIYKSSILINKQPKKNVKKNI
jgi:ribosomal protein S13